MGKDYLVDGAKLLCICGSEPGILKITKGHGYISRERKKANCKDCVEEENIPYFGTCQKNQKDGKCQGFMKLDEKWESLSVSLTESEKIDGENAIGMDSVLICKRGGIIFPLTSGQSQGNYIDKEALMRRFLKILLWAAGNNRECHVFGKDPINMNTGNYFYEREEYRETLIKAFPAPDLRCKAAYSPANPCASAEGSRDAMI